MPDKPFRQHAIEKNIDPAGEIVYFKPSIVSDIISSVTGQIRSMNHKTYVHIHSAFFTQRLRAIETENSLRTNKLTFLKVTRPEIDRRGNRHFHIDQESAQTSNSINLDNEIYAEPDVVCPELLNKTMRASVLEEMHKTRSMGGLSIPIIIMVLGAGAFIGLLVGEFTSDDTTAIEVQGDYNENKEETNNPEGTNKPEPVIVP